MRKQVIGAVRAAAEAYGYVFRTGFEHHMASEMKTEPTLWLLPLKLKKTEGRNEGVKYYEAAFKLMSGGQGPVTAVEDDAVSICEHIRHYGTIRDVTDISVAEEYIVAVGGKLPSCAVKCTIQSFFNR